jgi:flagellar basal-body rod modification protein FlgD
MSTNLNNYAQTISATSGTTSTQTADRNTSGVLGKDDFLKLLVAQLKNQDPMAPSTDQQWIGQMAQFSQLEQASNTAKDTSRIANQLGHAGALGLIGRTVTYYDGDDNPVSGVVEQVDMASDGKATLTIAGQAGIDATRVTQVK